jgi:hypothetical protein
MKPISPNHLMPGHRSLWLLMFAVAFISGCATPKSLVISPQVLPSDQFSTTNVPLVCVRTATPEERNQLLEFPGRKESERAAKWDMAGATVLAPAVVVFAWPDIIDNACRNGKSNKQHQADLKLALAEFQNQLATGIKQQFSNSPSPSAADRLEIVYVAGVQTIGPAADRAGFIFHARITYLNNSTVVLRDVIRIDPRAYSGDIPCPEPTESPSIITNYAKETIPKMIARRLPGLPWQTDL